MSNPPITPPAAVPGPTGAVPIEARVTFIVSCKGRLSFLKQSLPTMLAIPGSTVVVVDYDCPDRSGDWASQFPAVRVVRVRNRPRFSIAEARNAGATAVSDPWMCFTDADILFAPAFGTFTRSLDQNTLYTASETTVPGVSGTQLIPSPVFHHVSGYDETYKDWGDDDSDFVRRVTGLYGFARKAFPVEYLTHIEHGNELRSTYHDQQYVDLAWCGNSAYGHAKLDVMRLVRRELPAEGRRALYAMVRPAAERVLTANDPAAVENISIPVDVEAGSVTLTLETSLHFTLTRIPLAR